MSFEIKQPCTVESLFARLTTKENSAILHATTADRIEYIRQTAFNVDGGPPSVKMMAQLVEMIHHRFRNSGNVWLTHN